MTALCFSVLEKIAQVCVVYEVFEKLHPVVMSVVHSLNGLLMPEYFWLFGFEAKNREEMRSQMAKAKTESLLVIETRYALYTESDKLKVEAAYHEILRMVRPYEAQT